MFFEQKDKDRIDSGVCVNDHSGDILRHWQSNVYFWLLVLRPAAEDGDACHEASCRQRCHMIGVTNASISSSHVGSVGARCATFSRENLRQRFRAVVWHRPTWVPVSVMARTLSVVIEDEVGITSLRRSDDDDARWQHRR